MAKRKAFYGKSESFWERLLIEGLGHAANVAYTLASDWMNGARNQTPQAFAEPEERESLPTQKKPRRTRRPTPWWKVLGVPESAHINEIRSAYKEAMVKTHPDKVSHLSEKLKAAAEREAKRLNSAFDEAKRARGVS